MPGIPDGTIDEVRAASDLVDVVSDRVRLKKQGRRFVGLCPFHNEKSPSFSVDADQNLYYCFGCRRGGDVFKFVEEIEGVGFLDAVRLLADRAGIEVTEEGAGPEADRKGTLHAALRFAAGFYFDQLKGEAGQRGMAYLKNRGFTKEAVIAFGIGVAPDAWDALTTAATEAGFKPDVLEDVGLAKARQGGGGHYDVFRDRLMFPILSPIGKVLGFGGRILPDTTTGSDDYQPAKYVNSPETEIYHKSRVLYGMKQAKRAIRTEREAIVVEGYADVVSLWQAGVRNAVAASGTALTRDQMDLLGRLDVQRVILLFDADAAGQGAARKGIDVALDAGIAPYVVVLPEGADPDSFVRQFGADAFRRYLADERLDFVGFLVQRARASGALASPEGKSAAIREMLGTIRRLTDSIQAGEYLRKASEALGVYETDLRRQFDGVKPPPPPRRFEEPPPEVADALYASEPAVVVVRPEEVLLLRLMLAHKEPMVEHVLTRMGLDEFSPGAAREAVQALIDQFTAGAIDPAPFVRGDYGEAARTLVTESIVEKHSLSDNWTSKVGVAVPDRDGEPFAAATSAMRLLKLDRVQEAVEAAMREMQVRSRAGEEITDLQGHVNELNELRRQIERGEFMEWTPE